MRPAAYGTLLAAVWAAGAGAAPPEAAGLFQVWMPAVAEPSGALPLRSGVVQPGTDPGGVVEAPAESAVDGAAVPEGQRGGSVPGAAAVEAQRAASVPCGSPGMPVLLETTKPVELVDRGDRVLMRFAEWGVERTIYLRPGDGPPSGQRSALGASFGRWEGSTLAIFTLYIDYPFFDARGTRQSKDATVLERYTPSADGERLDYRVTVTDDATFTRPVVRAGFMTRGAVVTLEGLVARNCVG